MWKVLDLILCRTSEFQILTPEGRPQSVSIQMKGNEQYFPAVLFIYLYKSVHMFESVHDESWSVT